MAVYRRMEAATAKPTAGQRSRIPHHLIDLVDAADPFTVADYRQAAVPIIEDLHRRGRTPLVVGGTRLYLYALTEPFHEGPPPDPEFRSTLRDLPSAELYRRLEAADPESAARIAPADRKRLVRALEVWTLTGRSIEQVQRESRTRGGLYRAFWIALIRDRAELYQRVEARVDAMLAAGLVDEVRGFLDEGFTADTPSMQGHGYKEILRALLGEYSLAEGVRLLKRNTRRYVKYQLMWLRSRDDVHTIPADQPHGSIVDGVLSLVR